MADSIDARTRAVDKMKAEPGKEIATYQAAENQLLAIQAEQKQNLAMARAQSAATIQQNNMIAQAAEVAAAGGGAAQVQQVPINAATQGVLGKYGMGPTVSKSTQRSTQSITRQNITINNYNTTTNNTTNNVPNTGPVQGRPVVVNRDDTGRFKVWVSNVLAKQNEQAAIRDREYAKRESALSRSANKMTRKLESISGNLSEKLDPRNLNRTADGQFRMLLRLAGITAIGANWRKILGFAAGIEDKVSNFLNYFGIGTGGKESRMIKDIRYMLGGKKEDEGKSIISTLGETLFTGRDGKDSILTYLQKRIESWLSVRAKALNALTAPDIDISDPTRSMKNVAEYMVNALKILMGGPAAALSIAGSSAREKAVQQKQQVSDKGAKNGYGYGQMNSTSFKNKEGKQVNTIAGDLAIYQGLHVLSRDVDPRDRLVDAGAALRQTRSITTELADVNKKDIDTLYLLDGLRKLELTAREGKTSLPISENFLNRLSELGLNVGEIRKTLQTKKFKYINLELSDSEKEQLGTRATHKITLVDADDPRYKDYKAVTSDVNGYAIAGVDKKSGTVTMNVLTEKSMDILKQELAKATSTDAITFDPEDVESAMAINNLLTSKLKRKTTKDFDNAIKRSYEALDAGEEAKRINEENYRNSVLPDIIDRGKEAYDYMANKYNGLMSSVKKNALLKYTITPESYQDQSDPGGVITLPDGRQFDTDAAIREMNKNKHGDSTGYCYRYTAQGIDIGLGNNTDLNTPTSRRESFLGTGEAKEAGPKLEQLGFQEVPLNTPWKKGDVIVFQPNDKYYFDRNEVGHGHIAMNVGNGKWVSDFSQNTISGHNDALNAYSDYKIYRFGGLGQNPETTTTPDKVEEVTYPTNNALTTNILKNSLPTATPSWSYTPSRGNNDYSGQLYSSNIGFNGIKPVDMNELSVNLGLMNNQLIRMNQTLELGVQAAADNVDATRNNGQAIASAASMSAPKPQRQNATPLTTL